jgi:hypothetical protein
MTSAAVYKSRGQVAFVTGVTGVANVADVTDVAVEELEGEGGVRSATKSRMTCKA